MQGRSGSADGRSLRSARGVQGGLATHGVGGDTGPPAINASDLLFGHAVQIRSAQPGLQNAAQKKSRHEAMRAARRGTVSGYVTAEVRPHTDISLRSRPRSAGTNAAVTAASTQRALASMPGRLAVGSDRPVTPAISQAQRMRVSTWKLDSGAAAGMDAREHGAGLGASRQRGASSSAGRARRASGPSAALAGDPARAILNVSVISKRIGISLSETSSRSNRRGGYNTGAVPGMQPPVDSPEVGQSIAVASTRPGTPVAKRIATRKGRSTTARTRPAVAVVHHDGPVATLSEQAQSRSTLIAASNGHQRLEDASVRASMHPGQTVSELSSSQAGLHVGRCKDVDYSTLCSSVDWESCGGETTDLVGNENSPNADVRSRSVFAPYPTSRVGQPQHLGTELLAESHSFLSWLGDADHVLSFLSLPGSSNGSASSCGSDDEGSAQ